MQAAFVLQRLTPDVVRVLGKEEQIYLVFKMPGITQLLVAALLITWTASASPQFQKLGYEGPLRADGTVDSLQDELQLGSAPQRKDLLGRLGVSAELPAETRDAIELVTQVEKIEGTGAALLTLPCRSRSLYAFLYLLRKNAGGRWQAVDSVTLDCWWHPATHRLVFVPKHSGDLILAEHVGAGHGSGLAVDNMALYEVRGDKLVRVLITEQEKSKVTWGGPALRTERARSYHFPTAVLKKLSQPLCIGKTVSSPMVVQNLPGSHQSVAVAGHGRLILRPITPLPLLRFIGNVLL